VYEEIAPLVRSCLDGFNTCIFAYGQTGSGALTDPTACTAAGHQCMHAVQTTGHQGMHEA
jgi:hypothetical protein